MKFRVAKNNKSVSKRTDIIKDIQYKPFKSNQPLVVQVHTTVKNPCGSGGYLWVGTGDRHRGIWPRG